MGYRLSGDQLRSVLKKIGDIARQVGQAEYPHDPERLPSALQAIGEGRFGTVGGIFPSEILAPELIPENSKVIEDVTPSEFTFSDLEFIFLLQGNESAIDSKEMRQCAVKLRGNLGLVDCKKILAERHQIPNELQDEYIVFPGTVLYNHLDKNLRIPCIFSEFGSWFLSFTLHDRFSWNFKNVLLARIKQKQ